MTNWDSEIDDVARQIVRGEPGLGFKTRVLARIDPGHEELRSGRPAWTWPAIAIAMAALVAVVIVRAPWKSTTETASVERTADGPLEARRGAGPEGLGGPARGGALSADSADPPAGHDRPAAARSARAPDAGRTLPAPAPERIGVTDALAGGNGLESLEPPPLETARLETAPLGTDLMESPASIPMTMLAVAPLEVAALSGEAR